MLKYIYIDESGDLGLLGSKYLVLTALVVDNPASLDRIVKNMRRNKFRKQLKKAQEIRANSSSDDLRMYMLECLNAVAGAEVFHVVLPKQKVYSQYLLDNKHKQYNYVAGKLASSFATSKSDFEIRIDRSKGKQVLVEDFNKYFKGKLEEHNRSRKIEIFHSYSQGWSGLQFADMLAWAMFQKFERDNDTYAASVTIPQHVSLVW